MTAQRTAKDEVYEAMVDATAHLTAAASAYRKHAARSAALKPRAVSDQFFTTRAKDFEEAAARARAALAAWNKRRDMDEAMGPRKNPTHPMFRDHNCAYCGSGEKPCRQGNPSQCEYPRARND